ncbi:MAG: hypothetical protein IKU39_07380 [Lachnospiraceae bacterium]|nr:hypothetical protein [Lachnospiraceae bacterium]
MKFTKKMVIFILIIAVITGWNLFSDYQDRELRTQIWEEITQIYVIEMNVGSEIVDIYERIMESGEDESEKKTLVEEKIPESIKRISRHHDNLRTIESVFTIPAKTHLQWMESELGIMSKSESRFDEYKDSFLKENLGTYQWGLARNYYHNLKEHYAYFSDEDDFYRRYEWYTVYDIYKDNGWEEYRQKYDELVIEEMRIAEQKDTAFYEAYREWLFKREELSGTELEDYLQSEETKALLQLCEESIAADIDSFVYWDENTDMKVYVLYNYAKYHEEFLRNFQ